MLKILLFSHLFYLQHYKSKQGYSLTRFGPPYHLSQLSKQTVSFHPISAGSTSHHFPPLNFFRPSVYTCYYCFVFNQLETFIWIKFALFLQQSLFMSKVFELPTILQVYKLVLSFSYFLFHTVNVCTCMCVVYCKEKRCIGIWVFPWKKEELHQ